MNSLPVAAGLAYLAYQGVPGRVAKRALGAPDHVGEPQRDDEEWKFRGFGTEGITELTQTPVRLTGNNSPPQTRKVDEEYDAIVIGGAAAGLASAACLQRRGVRKVLVVEKNEQAGDIWRSRYHRLHLHDIAEECSLPGFAMPTDYPKYPTRQEFAKYLEAYAMLKQIDVQYLTLAKNAQKIENDMWEVTLQDLSSAATQQVKCHHLVLANGIYNDPFIPSTPKSSKEYAGLQVHSCRYTNGTELGLKGKRVLVVGFGNSAAEIALDLVEHGAEKPTLLVRSESTILPRWAVQHGQEMLHTHVLPLVSVPFGWLAVGVAALLVDPMVKLIQHVEWGGKFALKQEVGLPLSWKGPVTRAVLDQEPPVMDVGTIECVRKGLLQIQQGEILEFDGKLGVRFSQDDGFQEFDCIVWATGYKMFEGHVHIFNNETLEKVGTGVQALLEHRITPGREHPQVKGLWINFGRIAMLSSGADALAWNVAKELGVNGGENDVVDAKETWPMFLTKHVLVAGAFWAWGKRRSRL